MRRLWQLLDVFFFAIVILALAAWQFKNGTSGEVVVSCATDYGAKLAQTACPDAHIIRGGRGVDSRRELFRTHRPKAIVDALHPYAETMSQQLLTLSKELEIPHLRYLRPSQRDHTEVAYPAAEAARQAIACGKRIFLALGTRLLHHFLLAPEASNRQWFVRMMPVEESIQRAIALGIPRGQICAMQGPFSQNLNQALWRDWSIDCVVSKDDGAAGGYLSKRTAAQALDIPMIVIERPQIEYPRVSARITDIPAQLQQLLAEHSGENA